MGLLNDLKRIFFGAKSVSKSATKKTIEITKEKSEHLLDVTEDYLSDKHDALTEKIDNVKTNITDKSGEFVDNVKDKTSKIIDDITDSEAYKKTKEVLEKVEDGILDTGEKFMEKSKELIDGPGKEVAEKFKDTSEAIGGTIVSGGKTIIDKATGVTKKLGEKLDETIQKAEEYAKTHKDKNDSEFADTPLDIKDSELEDKDDFFDKADKFAAGDYGTSNATIIKEGTKPGSEDGITEIEGFEDRDSDGNPLIDDATIVEEEEKDLPDTKDENTEKDKNV